MTEDEQQRCIDLVFCVDETGSMGSYISQVKEHIISIISDVLQDPGVDSLRVGLVGYRDHPPQDSTFVTQVSALTEDVGQIKAAVNKMEANGGGDGPECMTDGLYECVRLKWRREAAKVVVLIADAPPHGVGKSGDGFPNGCPCGESWLTQAESLRESNIKAFSLGCVREGSITEQVMKVISGKTQAQYFPLSDVKDLIPLIKQGTKDELSRVVVRERVSELVHKHHAYLTGLPTEQSRLEAVTRLVIQSGIRMPSFQYHGSTSKSTLGGAAAVSSSEKEMTDGDVRGLLREMAVSGQLSSELFPSAGMPSAPPLPGLHIRPVTSTAAAASTTTSTTTASTTTTTTTTTTSTTSSSTSTAMIPLTKVEVEVDVSGLYAAQVTVRQEYVNKSDSAVEVTYTFPKESGAAVTYLRVRVNDRELVGKCVEKEEAQNRYDDAVASGHTAVLLEEVDRNVLSMNVGNLPAHGVAQCEVRYTIALSRLSGGNVNTRLFRLPTTIAPVFMSNNEGSGETVPSSGTSSTPKSVPYSLALRVTATTGSMVQGLRCVSHPTGCVSGEDGKSLSYETVDMGLAGDFVVEVRGSAEETQSKGSGVAVGSSGDGGSGGSSSSSISRSSGGSEEGVMVAEYSSVGPYAYATAVSFMPTLPTTPSSTLTSTSSSSSSTSESHGCNVCVMLDSSGSMQGVGMAQGVAFAEAFLRKLGGGSGCGGTSSSLAREWAQEVKKFSVMRFGSTQSFSFERKLVEVSTSNVEKGLVFMKDASSFCFGGTELLRALKVTLCGAVGKTHSDDSNKVKNWAELFSAKGQLPIFVVLITDGAISDVSEVEKLLEQVGPQVEMVVVGVGSAPYLSSLEQLARAGRSGAPHLIYGDDERRRSSDLVVEKVFQWCLCPLREVEITYECQCQGGSSNGSEAPYEVVCIPSLRHMAIIPGHPTAEHYMLWKRKNGSSSAKKGSEEGPSASTSSTPPALTVVATLRATTVSGRKLSWQAKLRLSMDVDGNGNETHGGIHELAARDAVEYFDERSEKAQALALALEYNLSSKYTSFVAVDPETSSVKSASKAPPTHILMHEHIGGEGFSAKVGLSGGAFFARGLDEELAERSDTLAVEAKAFRHCAKKTRSSNPFVSGVKAVASMLGGLGSSRKSHSAAAPPACPCPMSFSIASESCAPVVGGGGGGLEVMREKKKCDVACCKVSLDSSGIVSGGIGGGFDGGKPENEMLSAAKALCSRQDPAGFWKPKVAATYSLMQCISLPLKPEVINQFITSSASKPHLTALVVAVLQHYLASCEDVAIKESIAKAIAWLEAEGQKELLVQAKSFVERHKK